MLELPARRKQQQLDMLMDLARDGDVAQVDPEEVITQEVNSILYGNLEQEEPPEDPRAGLTVVLRRLSMPTRALTMEYAADHALQRRASFSPRSRHASPIEKRSQFSVPEHNVPPACDNKPMTFAAAEVLSPGHIALARAPLNCVVMPSL